MQRAVFIAAALVQAGAAEDPWAADALGLVAGVPVVDWRAPHRSAGVFSAAECANLTRAVVAALERAVAADAGAAACEAALAAAFREADAALAASAVESTYSGTTAVVVVRLGGTLVCGNAGDSRAVVVRRAGAGFEAAPLSRDHNPDLPDERRRVEAAGGFVSDPPAPGACANSCALEARHHGRFRRNRGSGHY